MPLSGGSPAWASHSTSPTAADCHSEPMAPLDDSPVQAPTSPQSGATWPDGRPDDQCTPPLSPHEHQTSHLSSSSAAPISIGRPSTTSPSPDANALNDHPGAYSFTPSSIRHQSLALGNLELTEPPNHRVSLLIPSQSSMPASYSFDYGPPPPLALHAGDYGTTSHPASQPLDRRASVFTTFSQSRRVSTYSEVDTGHLAPLTLLYGQPRLTTGENGPYRYPPGSPLVAAHPSPLAQETDALLGDSEPHQTPRRPDSEGATPHLGYVCIASPSLSPVASAHPQDPEPHSFTKRLSSNVAKMDADAITWPTVRLGQTLQKTLQPSRWPIGRWCYHLVECVPAVILGVIFTLLDAVSYGLILFPVAMPAFESFGPTGLAMFLVTTVISQLTFSGGASVFRGANGGMMIEAIPFLHTICEIIAGVVGPNNDHSLIATAMVAYALSTVLTGLTFFVLGYFNLGALIEFFPRHILVGCIGGVGYFLIQTAIEINAQLTIGFNLATLYALFELHTLALWGSSLAVALLLRGICWRYTHPFVIPLFFLAVPLVFYIVVLIGGWPLDYLRDAGWLFHLPDANVPFYDFYLKFDFAAIHWPALLRTLPAMFGLTFFGILHVPINVPALAVSTHMDHLDTNRELVAHGISNLLAGLTGTVQNYLIYSNSVFFIKSGGDSRVAGLLLAFVTVVILVAGMQIVGFMPTMVVGALIFHVGIDLLKEALYDTWGVVQNIEYVTIILIVVAMAGLGFIEGIFLGILLACIFFVVIYSRRRAIRSAYTGPTARSTVRRLYRQRQFLDYVGSQIQVLQLQGFMFFGTISSVETAIRHCLGERRWDTQPIRFLVLDFALVTGVDFSAAEAFTRIKRLLRARQVYLVLCGVQLHNEVGKALQAAKVCGLTPHDDPFTRTFSSLNQGLEWCENVLLEAYYLQRCHQPQQFDAWGPSALGGTANRLSAPSSPLGARPLSLVSTTDNQSPESTRPPMATKPAPSQSDLFQWAWQLNQPTEPLPHRPQGSSTAGAGALADLANLSGSTAAAKPIHSQAVSQLHRSFDSAPDLGSSPRFQQVLEATRVLIDDEQSTRRPQLSLQPGSDGHGNHGTGEARRSGGRSWLSQPANLQPPLGLLIQAFQGLDNVSYEDMLYTISRHFKRMAVHRGHTLWRTGEPPNGLYLVESGLLRLSVVLDDDVKHVESILPGTMLGELSLFTRKTRQDKVVAETDSVLWALSSADFEHLSQHEPALALEFMRLALCYSAQGIDNVTAFAFHP